METLGYTTPHSCEYCSRFVLERRSRGGEEVNETQLEAAKAIWGDSLNAQWGEELRHMTIFKVSIEELKVFSSNGCSFAKFLHDMVLEQPGSTEHAPIIGARFEGNCLEIGEILGTPREDHELRFLVFLSFDILQTHGMCHSSPYCTTSRLRLRSSKLTSISLSGDLAANSFGWEPINMQPGSETTLGLSRSWLTTCLATHAACARPSNTWMPTRVLEILRFSGRLQLRLQDTAGKAVEPYAALTYCWGGEQQVITTKYTIRQHRIVINLNTLSKSLQDAVVVTNSLGLKFLWVDALCIIQNDEIDKDLEIGNMCAVYSNATVVISASRARNVKEGFLGPRTPMGSNHPQRVFQLPYLHFAGSCGSLILVPEVSRIPDEPIDERAWTLQERILSTRFLEYGTMQTRWVCQSTGPLIDGWKSHRPFDEHRNDSIFIETLKAFNQLGNSFDKIIKDTKDLRRLWRSIVDIHSNRLLGFEKDRLRSLAGIAERFSVILNDEYVCGFWKRDLPRSLLWTSGSARLPTKPAHYIAPSWSWAANNSSVRMTVIGDNELDTNFQVKGSEVVLANPRSRFGALRSGYLEVEGCVLSATLNIEYQKLSLKLDNSLNEISPIWFQPDSLEAACLTGNGKVVRLYLLLVLVWRLSLDKSLLLRGLVLNKGPDGAYSRVGTFSHIRYPSGGPLEVLLNLFHNSTPRKLRII
jgi:hypothetical protein